jgi:hypothetical protein
MRLKNLEYAIFGFDDIMLNIGICELPFINPEYKHVNINIIIMWYN